MNSNSRWISATIALVVASLMIGGLEPAAFAQGAEEAPSPEAGVTENSSSPALANRPTTVTSKVAPVDRVAQVISQNQNSGIGNPPSRSSYIPPARQNSGKSKKWIWFLTAAAGAGVTVALLAKGDDPEIPTITIGDPTPGPPQ